ncbi:MAG: sirohydrochlorin cobaltochelatase [Ruminococcus sp.]
MILAKIEKRDHIHYDNVKEAMERMAQDGIEEVIVQPTHVMNGVENDLMKADVLAAANHFQSEKFGNPLLTTEEDNAYVVKTITDVFPVIRDKKTALVLLWVMEQSIMQIRFMPLLITDSKIWDMKM